MDITTYGASSSYGLYGQNDGVGDAAKVGSTTSASPAATSGMTSGDVVTISAEAHSAAATSSIPPYSFSTVRTFDMPNGVTATLSTAKNEYGETVAQLSYADKDGVQHNIFLDNSSILRLNESGEIEVIAYSESEETTEVIGALNINGGGKVTIERSVRHIQGSDANEIIILLPSNTKNTTAPTLHWNVDAGNGNNVVVDLSGEDVSIRTGNGNDTIIGMEGMHYTVDSGDGNDVIELNGNMILTINGGEGDDSISVKGNTYVRNIDGGNGNDTIDITGNFIGGVVTGGAGSDEMKLNGNILLGHIYGDNPDTQNAGNDTITIHGTVMRGEVRTGDGNNTVYVQNAFDAAVIGGSGNDSISVGRAIFTSIDGGDGDDTLQAEDLLNSVIVGGKGNNHIHARSAISSEIYAGTRKAPATDQESGDKPNGPSEPEQKTADSATKLTDSSVENADDGNNTIIVDSDFGSQIYGGGGNDSITVGNATVTHIDGGNGDDTISANLLHHSVIVGGKGDNAIHVLNSHSSEIIGGSKSENSKDKNTNDNAEKKLSEYERAIADAAIGIIDNTTGNKDTYSSINEETIVPTHESDISKASYLEEDTITHAAFRYSGRYVSGTNKRGGARFSLTI